MCGCWRGVARSMPVVLGRVVVGVAVARVEGGADGGQLGGGGGDGGAMMGQGVLMVGVVGGSRVLMMVLMGGGMGVGVGVGELRRQGRRRVGGLAWESACARWCLPRRLGWVVSVALGASHVSVARVVHEGACGRQRRRAGSIHGRRGSRGASSQATVRAG